MGYNKQVNPYGVASSELGWKGFADGGKHGNPGAVQVKDNPYAKFAAQMIGDIAWNAGKEFSAPEYKGIDELTGQPVYEQSGFSRAVYGPYPTPRGSILKRNLPAAHDAFNSRKTATDAQAQANADAVAKITAEAEAAAANKIRLKPTEELNTNDSAYQEALGLSSSQVDLRNRLYKTLQENRGNVGWTPEFLMGKKDLEIENMRDAHEDWIMGSGLNRDAAFQYFSKNRGDFPEYQKDPIGWYTKNIDKGKTNFKKHSWWGN